MADQNGFWTATELAAKFSVSVRTIYRDIRALEQAGIPIYVEEGKGYGLMDHYRPACDVYGTQANALITAKIDVLKNKDSSLINDYADAIDKNQVCPQSKGKRQSQPAFGTDPIQPTQGS
ncbi:MAG: HTH domain-containing protein [Caldilineaceae bacterium]